MSDSFSDWMAKISEAYCVLNGIACKRKFTDAELVRPMEEVRTASAQLYADVMIKRDKIARYEGRPDQDLDVFGRPLKAGS
mgnify:FL=1